MTYRRYDVATTAALNDVLMHDAWCTERLSHRCSNNNEKYEKIQKYFIHFKNALRTQLKE